MGRLEWKPLFADTKVEEKSTNDKVVHPIPPTKKLKVEIAKEKSRLGLQQTLVGNTKAAIDPFLHSGSMPASRFNLGILKRKRDTDTRGINAGPENVDAEAPTKKPALLEALVGYDSD